MKKLPLFLSLALSVSSPYAGVLFEMEFTDHRGSSPVVSSVEVTVEGRDLRMTIPASGAEGSGEVVFHGERSELIMIDHEQRSYYVIDREALRKIAAQLDAATNQMEAALANVPAEQRAMMEKMMNQRKSQAAPARSPIEVTITGESEESWGYPCVKYDLVRDGAKVGETWVTEWSNIEGGADLASTFEEMSELFREFTDTVVRATGKTGDFGPAFGEGPFEHLAAMNGFPVVARELEGGDVASESILRTATPRTFGPDDFAPPARYRKRKPFEGR